jgi:hypothetical protein
VEHALDGGTGGGEIPIEDDEPHARAERSPVGGLDHGHEPPVDACALPDVVDTVGALLVVDVVVVVVVVAVVVAVPPESAVVATAAVAEPLVAPLYVAAATQPSVPVPATPRTAVPIVMLRSRRFARDRASTRPLSVVFMPRCCGAPPFDFVTTRDACDLPGRRQAPQPVEVRRGLSDHE